METIFGLNNFKKSKYRKPFVLAIGTFDGVHRAHQAIIKAAIKTAKKLKGTSIILTFSPHPLKVLRPRNAPALLTSLEHRLRLVSKLKPEVCLVVDFKKRFSKLSPKNFAEKILRQIIGVACIIVGEKFNFGKDKSGNINYLKVLGKNLDYKVKILPSLTKKKQIISSSQIRKFIESGKLKEAEMMLGRRFSVLGTVEKGQKRGKIIGFPTANINPHHEALPPNGVYAVKVKSGQRQYKGMLNIGIRPTFNEGKKDRVIEVHIFSFNKNIYGQDIEIFFEKKVRPEKHFSSRLLLKKQLVKDRNLISKILSSRRSYK